MRTSFLVLCFFLLMSAVFAQQKPTKQNTSGKWKVAAMMYDGVYHNFDNDSTIYTPAATAKFKTKADSIKADLKNEMFFDMIKGTSRVFDGNGNCWEYDQQKNSTKGTYVLNDVTGIFNITVGKNVRQMQVWFYNGMLALRDVKNQKNIYYYTKQ